MMAKERHFSRVDTQISSTVKADCKIGRKMQKEQNTESEMQA